MSSSIVVVLPKIDDARKLAHILEKQGFSDVSAASNAASAIAILNQLEKGIIISTCRLPDMYYLELMDIIPKGFELILLAAVRYIDDIPPNITSIQMPFRTSQLIEAINGKLKLQTEQRKKARTKPKIRSEKEQNYINNAKRMLMETKNMTEEEAHRYIQKTSMDSGTGLAETAQMLLMLYST